MEEPDLLSFFESTYKAGAELAGAGPGSGRKRQSQSSRIRSQCHILQLVTRVLTTGHEHVAIPNTKVLSDSVTNYSTHGLNKGVAVSVVATIGYDVDWRRVHKLLLGEPRERKKSPPTQPRAYLNSSSGIIRWNTTCEHGRERQKEFLKAMPLCDATCWMPSQMAASRS